MKILIILEPIYPNPGNNALVISPILPILCKENEVCILATQFTDEDTKTDNYPDEWFGCKVYYPRLSAANGFIVSTTAKLAPAYHETIRKITALRREIARLDSQWHFDGVITTFKHNEQVAAALKVKTKRKILYILDPIRAVTDETCPSVNKHYWKRVLSAQKAILTTPFIKNRLEQSKIAKASIIIPVAFPKVEDHGFVRKLPDDNCYRLLFSGWLYSDIRSPQFFLDILSRLDERFIVTFMGRECQKLTEQFVIQTKAKIITLPQQPYDVAMQAIADADILINIGNSIPVHLPSKTLEYINSGKPIVNFYKLEDCPTLYYTRRYPLCLNIPENHSDINTAAERFVHFCVENKGKTVERDYIEREFEDSTPQYIAAKILGIMEK